MKEKAKTIIEFRELMDPEPITIEQKEFYVDFCKRELSKLRLKIIDTPLKNDCLYVAGQVGTGKSTALNFLPDEQIEKLFKVIH
jgi:putative ribosome biogenesis GTPase RsgA